MGVETVVAKEVSWLKAHERIVIVFLILAASVFAVNKIENVIAARDASQASVLIQQVQADKQNAAKIAQDALQQQAVFQTMLSTLQAQNATLSAAVQQDAALLKANRTKDATLPLPDLAVRWGQLVPLQPGDLTATATGVSVTPSGARATVVQLEAVPTLTDQLAKETQTAQNNASLLTQSGLVNADLGKQVGALNTELGDSAKQCKAEVAAVKAQARKSKLKWFGIGFVAGFLGRGAI